MSDYKPEDYVYPQVLPWEDIFNDLEAQGHTPFCVAELIGVTHSTVQRWEKGAEPRHSCGSAILELHRRYCGGQQTLRRFRERKNG